jgi:hypothetical protein
MRFPTYHAVLFLPLGAAVGSIITFIIVTREISPDIGQLLAKCELEATGKYNQNDFGEFLQSTYFIKLCMRTYNYQFNDDNHECDDIMRRNPGIIRLKKEYDAAQTQEEKDKINRRTGEIVIALNSLQASTPACYERTNSALEEAAKKRRITEDLVNDSAFLRTFRPPR